MKNFTLIILLFCCHSLIAQKQTERLIDAAKLERIILQSDEIYRITVSTAPVETISIKSRADGEYYNNISLDTEVVGKQLFLKSRFREILQSGFDKLSAHKVFAMEIELVISEAMELEVNSNVASVYISGIYDRVLVQLKGGSCYLKNFSGDALINTFDGNIEVVTRAAKIEADSRHGKIEIPENSSGIYNISLNSINGNIKVQETK